MKDQIKAIIFDIGGVILRTEDYSSRNKLAERFGMTRNQLETLVFDSESAMEATLGKKTAAEHWQTTWEGLLIPENEWKDCEEAFWDGDQMDVTLIDFLRDQQKIRKTVLLSNAWSDLRRRLTHDFPCLDAFDIPIFSYEVKLAKPDPAIYRLALQRVEAEPQQVIFVDDNEANIRSAASLGIHAVQFRNTAQALARVRKIVQD